MIQRLVEDINKALDNECYFSALALALTLPDACGKAEYKIEGAKRYKEWCKEYVCKTENSDSPYSADMPYLSDEITYQLRCLLLHQNTPNVNSSRISEDRCKVDKFVLCISDDPFLDNGTSMVSYGAGMKIVERSYEISIQYLCHILCKSAIRYYKENREKFDFINFHLIDKRKEEC